MKNNVSMLIFLLISSGCAGSIHDQYVSKSKDNGNAYESWHNGVVKIQLENGRVYIKPDNAKLSRDGVLFWPYIPVVGKNGALNERYSKGNFLRSEGDDLVNGVYVDRRIYGDYFYIEFCVRADKEDLEFNPLEAYLQLENGQIIQASKYIKPEMRLRAPNPNWGTQNLIQGSAKDGYNWTLAKYEQSTNQYFHLGKGEWEGFAIRFETLTPNPGTPFALRIKGLKQSGSVVSVPEVIFDDKKIYRNVTF
jgi:hypothetical protein